MFDDSSEARAFYERMKALNKTYGIYRMETFGSSTVGDVPGFSGKELWRHIKGKTGVVTGACCLAVNEPSSSVSQGNNELWMLRHVCAKVSCNLFICR